MSQLVKLEKRFEIVLEKLELAFATKNPMKISESPNEKKEIIKENDNNIADLLIKIARLESAAKDDADEIDKLVKKLREIFEIEYD
tara:strand:- start:275 stop:532 length:258 start_codon:yes stop_codon:yes gene_type:complete